jgi:dimethylhistidine N-methyltransferase
MPLMTSPMMSTIVFSYILILMPFQQTKVASGFFQINQVGGSADAAILAIQTELCAGLLAQNASASPKYLYDALGSILFEAICVLPEYYPTRTEAAIFDAHLAEIGRAIGPGTTLIDLGAGNCAKAARLFSQLHPHQYVPIDISVDHLREAVTRLQHAFPHIEMTGVGLDFSQSLVLPGVVRPDKRLFFYPGSSIGNFSPPEAVAFLQRLRAACGTDGDGGLLIGIDLIKDKPILDAAYDDALGVTAAFNLNLLLHANRVLGSDFVPRDWQHIGFFNAEKNRVEMHLEARRAVLVSWPGHERRFEQGERIHTENSYKYTTEGALDLLAQAGFKKVNMWTDPAQWFAVVYARAV